MPDSSDNYQLPSWPPTAINRDLWNAVMGSIGDRLRAREELEADFEALIAQGTQASLDYIQATVAPQIASLQTSIELAQEQIDQIIVDGIAPNAAKLGGQLPAYYAPASALPLKADVTYVDSELLDLATAIQLLLDQKAGATETANALSKRTRVDAAQSFTLTEQGQARANIGGGVLAGFRNKIINGCAEVTQRGSAFNIPAGQAAYTADRIRIYNSTNQTLNVQCPVVIPFAGSGKHPRLRLAFAVAPTSGNVFVTQRIEGADTLAGRKATMSFAHAAGEVVTASCYLGQNFGSGGSAGAGPAAQNFALRNDGGIGIAKLVFDLPSTEGKIFGTGDFLEWAISIPVRSTQPLTITRMSLVEGDATAEDDPFAPRHPQQERDLCERYFEIVSGGYSGPVTGGNGYWGFGYPRVKKRATPTVSWYRGQAVFRFPNSAPVIENVTPDGAIAFRMAATATGDGAYAIHGFFVDAEL